ncbi:MAG: DUF2256 domain-containing protein [Verrucomicrobiaceae bacterium]|nr:MAG: DUF2256 domain-containing protein [Verrucomicrobiaceae bacterium]
MKGVKKQNLPSKICAHCLRPFSWRKKWARNWEDVRFCSDACRTGKMPAPDGHRLKVTKDNQSGRS